LPRASSGDNADFRVGGADAKLKIA
jgi:hypothetical protein